jgi:hypothetical protein
MDAIYIQLWEIGNYSEWIYIDEYEAEMYDDFIKEVSNNGRGKNRKLDTC